MSKAGGRKKGDGDVLRAGDMAPPYGDKTGTSKKKTSRKKTSASKKTLKKAGAKRKTTKASAARSNASDIPQLDLDRQILAKQRKVTSVRRKGPGAKSKASAETGEIASPGRRAIRVVPELPEQDRIIAEIVARDIERLCRR